MPLHLPALFLAIAANGAPHSFTIVDFWQGKCDAGEQEACARVEQNQLAEAKLDKLNALATEFRDSIDEPEFLLDEKPNLGKAYPLAVRAYLKGFKDSGLPPAEEAVIEYCARHFHDYWLNTKYWWPTDIEDQPDWGTIFVYIVDHYHGICLRQAF